MDILPLHIEYLLTRHDCVIVPGLGAFIASETEACIDLEKGVIRPRRRMISFNSSVVTDDGLLSHSIARREGLVYEDARRLTAQLTERMMADLNQEGEVSVGMIGRLIKDEEGLISFHPRQSASTADILDEVKLTTRAIDVDSALDAQQPSTVIEDPEEDDGMRTIRVKADRYVFTIRKRTVHAMAMVIAVMTIGISLLMPINHDNEQKASVISIEDFFHHSIRTEAFKSGAEKTPDVAAGLAENDSTTANIHVDRLKIEEKQP